MNSKFPWLFSNRKKLIMEIEELKGQLEDSKVSYETLVSKVERWRRKSDLMDMLGDEAMFKKLAEYGSLESILSRVADYERIQNSHKMLERKNRKLETELEELEKGE